MKGYCCECRKDVNCKVEKKVVDMIAERVVESCMKSSAFKEKK